MLHKKLNGKWRLNWSINKTKVTNLIGKLWDPTKPAEYQIEMKSGMDINDLYVCMNITENQKIIAGFSALLSQIIDVECFEAKNKETNQTIATVHVKDVLFH